MSAKQEGHIVGLVEITNENRATLRDIALSAYLGECCKYCEKKYTSLEMLEDAVWAGEHENGRIACSSCWKNQGGQK